MVQFHVLLDQSRMLLRLASSGQSGHIMIKVPVIVHLFYNEIIYFLA